jgi:hypothetical protein
MAIDLRSRRVLLGTSYVLVVSSLAIAAQVTQNGRFYLAALVLTLPIGLIAVVGVYVVYGLMVQAVTAVSSGLTGDQISARTRDLTAPVNVALFAAAAVVNVLVLRSIFVGRRTTAS